MVRSDVVLLGCLLSFVGAAQSPPVVLTSNATFGPSDPTLAGMDVVVQGCTVTLNGPHNLQSLTVQGAGVVTHSANFSHLGAFGMHLTVAGDVFVQAGSLIHANRRGYPAGTGPGAGPTGPVIAEGGAGHGGGGGYGSGNFGTTVGGGPAYGDYAAPNLPGSGGASCCGGAEREGGGVIRLTVGGTLTVDGVVSADGYTGGGSGAGGSVWIDCGTFAGSGVVRANGGTHIYGGGGSGGGRVAIYAASSTYVGAVTALQGAGTPASAGRGGGAGSVFFGNASPGGTLIYDGGGVLADVGSPLPGGTDVGRLEVRGGAGALLGVAGADVTGDVIVDGVGSRLRVDGPLSAGGDVAVLNGAFVDHTSGIWTGAITAGGAMTIGAGSFITADVRGHLPTMGPGAGVTGNSNAVGGGAYGGGGGWGLGGNGWTAGGGAPYGDYAAPTLPGSGGGGGPTVGMGGGVVRLSVGGTLTLDGIVTANGQSAASSGAGGSVWIDCATFAGTGVVRANGGANTASGGGGGGGRVAIYATSSTYVGAVTALQGAATPLSAGRNGGVGTVFLGYASPGGTLIYDGGGVAAHVATTSPSDLKIGALIVEGGAVARIGTAGIRLLQDLQVDGAGTSLIVDGTVHAGGAAAITGGAVVTHTQATEGARLVTGGDFLLDAASSVNLNGKGQVSMSAPGHGHPFCSLLYQPCTATPTLPTGYGGGGGANGGAGGVSLLFCCCATTPQNFALNPSATAATLGGAGGTGSATGYAGGGAFRLDVGGVCTILGSVTANGASAPTVGDNGGGAGGSILISAPAYGAAATIYAVGGNGHGLGGGGGGGAVRVAGPPALSAVVVGGINVNISCGAFGAANATALQGVVGATAIGAAFGYFIETQPASATLCEGGNATFCSGGNGPCQWRRNGVPLVDGGGVSGATTHTLVVAGATPAHAGVYDCVVGDAVYATPAVSSGATLVVHTAPIIAVSPGSGVQFNESPLTLTAAVAGSPAPTLQWTKNGAAIPGATGPTLSFASLAFADAGTYACEAVNLCGSATSAAVAVTVENPAPTLSALSPSSAIVGSPGAFVLLQGSGFVSTSAARRDGVALRTTFVDASTLGVALSASDLAAAGTASLDVVNTGPGGGVSGGLAFTTANPLPATSSLTPDRVLAGSGAHTLAIVGSGFVASSVVHWDGVALATTFVSESELSADLPASLARGHRTVFVGVSSPGPGGGGAATTPFAVVRPHLVSSTPSGLPAPPPIGGPPTSLLLTGSDFAPGCVAYANQIALATTFVDSSTVVADLVATDATQFPGALVLTVVNYVIETSNHVQFLTAPGRYVGTIGQDPPQPMPGGLITIKLEGAAPGTPFVLLIDFWNMFSLPIPHSAGLSAFLIVDPLMSLPLVDGFGLYGPPNPFGVFVPGANTAPPFGEFAIPGIALPFPPIGLEVTLQAAVFDPTAGLSVGLTVPSFRCDI